MDSSDASHHAASALATAVTFFGSCREASRLRQHKVAEALSTDQKLAPCMDRHFIWLIDGTLHSVIEFQYCKIKPGYY